jgi:hypothetical protein
MDSRCWTSARAMLMVRLSSLYCRLYTWSWSNNMGRARPSTLHEEVQQPRGGGGVWGGNNNNLLEGGPAGCCSSPPTLYFHLRPPKWPVWSIHWPTDEPAHTTSKKSACVSSRTDAGRVAIAVPLIHSTRLIRCPFNTKKWLPLN